MRTIASVCTMLAVVLAISAAVSAVSIEAEPVKVTHRNSGPRYEIDEVERAKQAMNEVDKRVPSAAPGEQPAREPAAEAPSEEVPAVGRVAIRRVFLFPVMRPGEELSAQDSSEESRRQHGGDREQENLEPKVPLLFAKPFWPFMTPARPAPSRQHEDDHERPHHIIRHLFGADEASRPPAGAEDQDQAPSGRDEQHSGPPRALIDPFQMMMDMMHQAISSHLGPNFTKDLSNSKTDNKDKDETSGDNSPAESSDERPLMPAGAGHFGQPNLFGMNPAELGGPQNETREDIVEIEGRKYLRKTVVNRHVGDNIVLMTRRLIFVPLNETESGAGETAPTDSPASASPASATPNTGEVSGEVPSLTGVHRVGSNKPTASNDQDGTTPTSAPTPSSTTEATTTTTTSTTTEEPRTTSVKPESAEPREEMTVMPKSPSVERAETNNKAAERLVEPSAAPKPSEAAEKPAASSA